MRKVKYFIWFGVIVFLIACNEKEKSHAGHRVDTPKEIYTCSMHPEIIRDKPGKCPICGMELVKKETIGNKIVESDLESLLKPTDEFVVSSIPFTSIQKREEEIEIKALGNIGYDTRQVASISARVSGRIEKLYVKYRYQWINKGQRIFDVYSPELLTAQQNLLFILKNDAANKSLISAAKQRLLLLGVSERQISKIIQAGQPSLTLSVYSNYAGHIHEVGSNDKMNASPRLMKDVSQITEELSLKEGMYVEKGKSVFSVYNPARAWVALNIYGDNEAMVKVGNKVRVVPETAPTRDFRATIDYIEPFYRKESKTLTARVYFDNSTLNIPIGSQVNATIFGNAKDAYWLPKEAVLSLGLNKIVFQKSDGGFKAHKINTGIEHEGHIQVLNGLHEKDTVAGNAQYLMDSEVFIKVKN